jgi:hypothetical protein
VVEYFATAAGDQIRNLGASACLFTLRSCFRPIFQVAEFVLLMVRNLTVGRWGKVVVPTFNSTEKSEEAT